MSWDSWKERISLIIDSRPVLQGRSLEDIEKLFYDRQAIYSNHHSKVETDNLDIEEVANYIVDSLKQLGIFINLNEIKVCSLNKPLQKDVA